MKKNSFKYVILLFLIVFLIPINVFAKGKITLTTDEETLTEGEEVIATAKISGKEKIYSLISTLSYDANVFEAIDDSDFIVDDENINVIYNTSNHKFGIINKSGEIKKELFKVKLTVKKNPNVGKTRIALTNISSSDGDKKTNYKKISSEVLVTRDAKEGEVLPTNKTNEVKDTKEDIIKTFSTCPIIFWLIILIIILAISCFIAIISNNKNKKRIIASLSVAIVGLFLILISLYITNIDKGDINKDGKKDYKDAEEIIKYIIGIEGKKTDEEETEEELDAQESNDFGNVKKLSYNKKTSIRKIKRYGNRTAFNNDINHDGYVDVNDAAGEVHHVTEEINYKVDLHEVEDKDNYYITKGNEIILKFNADINPYEEIKEVVIDGKTYPVIKTSSAYHVKLNAPTTAGVHEFKITQVTLSNGRKINTNLNIKKEVLKDKPYVDMFDVDNEKGTFNFNLEDKDNAFIEGTIIIYDDKGEEVLKEDVGKENHFKHKFEEGKIYTIVVNSSYDLDSNKDEKPNHYENEEIFNHTFQVDSDYDFQLENVTITDAVQIGEKLKISFDATTAQGYEVEYIVIKGIEYNVIKKEGNHYEFILDQLDTSKTGKFHLDIDEIALNNFKVFKKDEDYELNSLTYTVLKKAPTAENITLVNNKNTKSIDAEFKLVDDNSASTKLTVALVDSTGKITSTKTLTKEEFSKNPIKVSLPYDYDTTKMYTDGRYTFKVLADYQLADKYSYTDESIGQKEILTNSIEDIYISDMFITNDRNERTNNLYPTKNERNYQVAIEVTVGESVKNKRAYSRVSGVTINGLNYPASQVSGYKSKIYLTVPSTAGVLDITANRVELANDGYWRIYNDYYAVEDKTLQIDVQKDKPKIENLDIVDDYEKGEATFNFDVVLDDTATTSDDEFKDGIIELNGEEQEIKRGNNSIKFKDIKQDENFDLKFFGSFDLDTDKLNHITEDQNEKTKEELYKVRYGLYNEETYNKISIENGTALSKEGNKYFEKNEEVKLKFDISNVDEKLEANPEKVIIDDKVYTINKTEEGYELVLDGYPKSGKKEITITDIILENGKKITLEKPYTFNIEVLKNIPRIDDFNYEDLGNDLKVTFDLKDPDKSLVGKAKVKITDNNGKVLYNNEYQDEITFAKEKDSTIYYVEVITDYDRDTDKNEDSENHKKDYTLLDEIISLEKNNIELKGINDISLYKIETESGEEKTILKDEVDVEELKNHKEDYFVEIAMDNLPTTRARIKSVIDEDDTLTLVLDYESVTKEFSKETQTIRIDFGTIKSGIAKNEFHPKDAFKVLLENLEAGKNVTLKRNYDASSLDVDGDTYVKADYSGTLNGNGYTIKNLTKPLFGNISEGEVKNLKLEKITLQNATQLGALSNTASQSKISNILIDGYTKTNGDTGTGSLIGKVTNNSEIKECRVINLDLYIGYLKQQCGAFIGILQNSKVQDSYVVGKMNASWNYIGGFVGNASNSTISNSYTKVNLSGNIGSVACGFACSTDAKNLKINNSITLGTGYNANPFAGTSNNNYQYVTSDNAKTQAEVTNINKDEINNNLFSERAKFDDKIWLIGKTSYDNTPVFQIERQTNLSDTSNKEYDESKENLYNNLLKLTPFYDSNKIIESAENIDNELLKDEEIAHIVPLDQNGNIVTYLTSDNPKKIRKIKIVFKNKKTSEYDVKYKKTYDMVATYNIAKLNIDYHYNHYVINSDSQIINNLTNYLDSLDYTNNLDSLTTATESRIYRDFYNDTTKKELKEFVLKILSNSNYTNTTNDEGINNYLEREIKKDKKLEKALYTYNYFRRFYDLDIDGMKVYDFMMFNMQGFDNSLTPMEISNLYLKDESGASFNTNQTNAKYREILGNYTQLDSIPKLLEFLVTSFSNQKMNDWTHNQFKGIIYEFGVENEPEIKYTLWDHFISDKRDEILNQFLPILTLPENAAYIMSMPVQYIIGSQRTYIENPDDPADEQKLRDKMDTYKNRYKRYFATAYSILEDKDLFNNIHIYQVDKRLTKTENGGTMYNTPYTTEEPFHKNYVEVTGAWAAAAGNNAAAWNPRVEWQVAGIFDSELAPDGKNDTSHVTFRTWSHETAHVIDAALFLKNNGRRYDAGGEDYADCFLMQSFGPNDITMNISMLLTEDKNSVASNLTPSRIASPDKIKDFYSKMFKTIYIMDYIEAQAFLQLSPEDQSEVAVQVSYPDEDKLSDEANKHTAYRTTRYDEKKAEDFEAMNLQTINDLYDKKIMLYPGIYKNASRGTNSYGGEGINTVHWYQPHNDYGRPDSYALKWLSYEMMGLKGYDDGFVEYASNINNDKGYKTDLMAYQKITGYSNFDDYKKARFKYVEDNIEKLNKVIDINKYVRKFYKALKADGEYGKERVKQAIGTGTEESCLGNYWCRASIQSAKSLPNSSEVRREIYYELKNGNNDFETDNIYMSTKQQDADFTIPESEKEEEPEETAIIEDPFANSAQVESNTEDKKETSVDKNTTDEDTTKENITEDNSIPTPPEDVPANPDSAIVEQQKSEEKQGLQQDDPTNTTNTVGPEPDQNPDSVQTSAVVLPVS